MQRSNQPEILDQLGTAVTSRELAENLADLAWINQLLGTRRAICRAVWQVIEADDRRATRRSIRVADIGAGTSDVLALLHKQAQQRRVTIDSIALEYDPAVLACLKQAAPAQAAIGGDAQRLPFASASIDILICAQMLHHLTPEQVHAVLGEYQRVARLGIVLFDLDRSRLAQLGAFLLTHALSRNRLTRHDGVLSVARAYHPQEIADLRPGHGTQPNPADNPDQIGDHRRGSWHFARIFPFRWLAVYAVAPR